MQQDVVVACTLPGPAQVLFARHFASRLNEHGRTLSDAELIAACKTAAGVVVTATDAMTAATIRALPDSVRVIATYSVGHDHIDF